MPAPWSLPVTESGRGSGSTVSAAKSVSVMADSAADTFSYATPRLFTVEPMVKSGTRQTASQRADLRDRAIENVLAVGQVIAGQAVGSAAAERTEVSVERVAEVPVETELMPIDALPVAETCEPSGKVRSATGDVEGARNSACRNCRGNIQTHIEVGVAIADGKAR